MSQPITNLLELAESIADQPQLFAAPDVSAVRTAREYAHTGRWTIQHPETVQQIVAAWFSTGSMRKVADLVGVSRNTVSCVIRILEAAGKLEPLKTRFERARLETGMEQLEWVREVIENRDLEAAAVVLKPGWVGVGIVSDKEAAQLPVAVNVHVHQGPVESPADPVAEYERMLRRARTAVVVDVESAVPTLEAPPFEGRTASATALATVPPLPLTPIPPPSTPTADPDLDQETGGGGSVSSGRSGASVG